MAKNENGQYVKARHAVNRPSKAVRRRDTHMQRRCDNAVMVTGRDTLTAGQGRRIPGSQNPRKYRRA